VGVAAFALESGLFGSRGVDRFEGPFFTADDDDAVLAGSEFGMPERYVMTSRCEIDRVACGNAQGRAPVDANFGRGVYLKADTRERLSCDRHRVREREAADLHETDPCENGCARSRECGRADGVA
jgi:hypothetical protein